MYCSYCGTEALPDARYCGTCGRPLAAEGVAQTPSPKPAPHKQPLPVPQPSSGKRRRLRSALFIVVPIIVLAAAGAGAYLGLRGSDSAPEPGGGGHSLVSIIRDAGRNTWTKLSPSGTPPIGRDGYAMAYDPTADEVIIFGGANQFGDVLLNDIWAYDPGKNAWRKLKPSGTPPSVRANPSVVYVLASDKVIMFGGDDMNSVLNDTWAYDPVANAWSDLSPSGPLPLARTGQSMVYDSGTGQVIMFGGNGENGFFNDTWAYDPSKNTWRNLSPSGPLPPPRSAQSMVYDSASGQVIMFGGTKDKSDLNDTWAYDPIVNTWSDLSPSGPLPPACSSCLMSYDSSSDQVIMFGGWVADKVLWDTWSYDLAVNAWTKLNPPGQTPIDNHSSMVYASSAGVAITLDGISGETWVYKP